MTPTDTIIALEKALEYVTAQHDRVAVTVDGRLDLLRDRRDANENFSAVCSPLAIRTLLDAHASALRDAERLREALKRITAIEDCYSGTDWQEIEEAREIARSALDDNTKGAAE